MLLGGLCVVAAVAFAVLALEVAPGIPGPGSEADAVEFVDGTALTLGSLVTLLLTAAASLLWWPAALTAHVGTCLILWLVLREALQRYQESGYGTQVEGMGQGYTVVYAGIGLVIVLIGYARSLRRARRAGG